MLPEVFEADDFLQVSSAKRLVKISGMGRAIDLKFSQVKYMGLLHMHMGPWVYYGATTIMVTEIGTK
jgi:hypothetical protein